LLGSRQATDVLLCSHIFSRPHFLQVTVFKKRPKVCVFSVQVVIAARQLAVAFFLATVYRVARFFLTQYAKTGKNKPNYHNITQWP
jgi:hypothetical protein